VDGWIGGWMDE